MKTVWLTIFLLFSALPIEAATFTVERGSDVQAVIDNAYDGDTLILAAKTFQANPTAFIDPLCGNCLDPQTDVRTSRGFIVKGKGLVIIGESRTGTILVTNGGYGIYFEDSYGSELRNLTVTGGQRSDDGNATDAAVVVRRSSVRVINADIRDNDHRSPDSSVIVGIGGIFGREGADIVVSNCNIINNQWDGVALYRGARAVITDCIIKDGRGAGIGVTWDATCEAYRNEISGYWKGIGSFGSSHLIARNNLVYDNLAWGVIATDQSYMDAANNVIYHNGQCGFAPFSSECRGRFINNIVTENGWRDRGERNICPCVGVQNYGDWAKWVFRNNIVYKNLAGDYNDIFDQTGINENLKVDPGFRQDGSYRLMPDSPALHAGDSTIYNTDGSQSHIGLTGGPQAHD